MQNLTTQLQGDRLIFLPWNVVIILNSVSFACDRPSTLGPSIKYVLHTLTPREDPKRPVQYKHRWTQSLENTIKNLRKTQYVMYTP